MHSVQTPKSVWHGKGHGSAQSIFKSRQFFLAWHPHNCTFSMNVSASISGILSKIRNYNFGEEKNRILLSARDSTYLNSMLYSCGAHFSVIIFNNRLPLPLFGRFQWQTKHIVIIDIQCTFTLYFVHPFLDFMSAHIFGRTCFSFEKSFDCVAN